MNERAFNSGPVPTGSRQGRLAQGVKKPETPTRCTHYIDGVILCDAFPSWEVPGTNGKQRRCEQHRGIGDR
jgi:hypothetical protein